MIAIWYLLIYTSGAITVVPQRDQVQCEWNERKLTREFYLVKCIPGVIQMYYPPEIKKGVER